MAPIAMATASAAFCALVWRPGPVQYGGGGANKGGGIRDTLNHTGACDPRGGGANKGNSE
jgi:hypothetical protein